MEYVHIIHRDTQTYCIHNTVLCIDLVFYYVLPKYLFEPVALFLTVDFYNCDVNYF